MCSVIFWTFCFCVFSLCTFCCGARGNAPLGVLRKEASRVNKAFLTLSLDWRITVHMYICLICYESCKPFPCFNYFEWNYLRILIWCFSVVSHVNRHRKNRMNDRLLCRHFMPSYVLLIVFLYKYHKITPYVIFHCCHLRQLIVSSQSKELYWIVCLNIFIQIQKGISVLFLISPSKYSLCSFEESSSLKLDKENWKCFTFQV